MITTPTILKDIKAFTHQTRIIEVKEMFQETTFSHFPVVDDGLLIGLIAAADVQIMENNEKCLGDFNHLLTTFYALEKNNLLEIFNVFAANETNVVPVVNNQREYLGYFELINVLHIYNDTPFIHHHGEVILVEKEARDYSFSQICQIIESNNGKLLGIFVADSNSATVKVLIKFTAQEVNEVFRALRRYNYIILTSHDSDLYLEELQERSNYLQKFLDI
jgi:CBS domain-containing protein